MIDPVREGVAEEDWKAATAHTHALRVSRIVEETADARSIALAVPEELGRTFRYRAGQFLSFKIPYRGAVLTRSYSLSSSPECDEEHRFTVKRVDRGRVSQWMNESLEVGDVLQVTPPAGRFVLDDSDRPLVFFSGGSGITPCFSLIKTAMVTTREVPA